MATQLKDVRKLLAEAKKELLGKSNVNAVGVGYKTTAGKKTDDLCIVCSVEVKKSKESLPGRDLIPKTIQGVPTDVNPIGVLRALEDPTGRFRPAPGGVSCGHFNITAGTLGCWVKKNDKLYILSNNHVIANSNNANIGDNILQPGPYDGGNNPADKIAVLSEYVPIQFEGVGGADPCGVAGAVASVLNWLAGLFGSSTRLHARRDIEAENLVDAAIAEPVDPNDILNEILEIGAINGITEGELGMSLQKSGRTTGFTTGSIQQIDVTAQVNYGSNQIATFVDQLMAGAMSQGGDSGSAVLNDQSQMVGLLFAGSPTSTIINRVQNVFSTLQITLP